MKCINCKKTITRFAKTGHCRSCAQLGNTKSLGKKISAIGRKNISNAKLGSKNPMWKGDKVKYGSLHDWVKWHKPKSSKCESCGIQKPLDLANISHKYLRDLSDWEWLCRRCHMEKDGRLSILKVVHRGKKYVSSRSMP